jgi:hypothetical protein
MRERHATARTADWPRCRCGEAPARESAESAVGVVLAVTSAHHPALRVWTGAQAAGVPNHDPRRSVAPDCGRWETLVLRTLSSVWDGRGLHRVRAGLGRELDGAAVLGRSIGATRAERNNVDLRRLPPAFVAE